jgi:type IV pilus assembly protein PilA
MQMNPRHSPARTARRADAGFTLLEGVIVVAVTALVGAVAVSAVRTYLVRAEIAESLTFAKYTQDEVTRAFRRTGTPPADGTGAGVPNDHLDTGGRYLAEVRVTDGRIDLVFGADASGAVAGRTLPLTPFETVDGQVVWICGGRPPGVGLKPLGFAGGGRMAAQAPTTIEPRYLPPACR